MRAAYADKAQDPVVRVHRRSDFSALRGSTGTALTNVARAVSASRNLNRHDPVIQQRTRMSEAIIAWMSLGFPQLPLEIPRTRRLPGSGGYNAELLAAVTAPTGQVITVDLDPYVMRSAATIRSAAGPGRTAAPTPPPRRYRSAGAPTGSTASSTSTPYRPPTSCGISAKASPCKAAVCSSCSPSTSWSTSTTRDPRSTTPVRPTVYSPTAASWSRAYPTPRSFCTTTPPTRTSPPKWWNGGTRSGTASATSTRSLT